jgi:uncharacterized hydrophobic protein (TIGR00271 family)
MPPLSQFKSSLADLWKRLSGDWHLLQDTPLSAADIRESFSQNSLPIFHYYILLVFAATISTFGLLTNSAATIIGGMLIAPLMTPALTLGYSTISLDRKLVQRSLFAAGTGMALVVTIAWLTTTLLGLRLVNSEILSRTHPNLLDLGVAIAAGAAGAFAWARPRIANAVPGVAIAVALVPPLCVVGIALGPGSTGESMLARQAGDDTHVAIGAFLLFATNVVGIIFSASVVFLIHGYGQLRKAVVGMSLLTLALILITWPLDFSLRKLYAKAAVYRSMEELRHQKAEIFSGRSEILSMDIDYIDGTYHLELDVVVPRQELPTFQERVDLVSKALSEKLEKPVLAEIHVLPTEVFRTAPPTQLGAEKSPSPP